MEESILRVAVPSPLRRLFDYLPPAGAETACAAGQRVRVPFGRGEAVGLIVEVTGHTEVPRERLRPALTLLDSEPLLPPPLRELLNWAGAYHHHAQGEVWHTALPVLLRQGAAADVQGVDTWLIEAAGREALTDALRRRAPRQAVLLGRLGEAAQGLDAEQLNGGDSDWRSVMRRLEDKGWVRREQRPCLPPGSASQAPEPGPEPNAEQAAAVAAITGAADSFTPLLLDGVTGSGKTEVYLRAIAEELAAGRQSLVLVPEIGLTPQLLRRFRRRLGCPIAVLHSGLTERERLCAWLAARDGRVPVVIGTRSAVFTPLARPGLIIVDEEHDGSFKQQDGFRYSARDVAVMRANLEQVPIVLGSATPSLETLHNALRGRYRHLRLPQRAGAARPPAMRLVDMRNQKVEDGLSLPLLQAIGQHLERGGQVLVFLNRRGFAPTLLCHECGWVSQCPRCESHLTFHAGERRLRCHHCASERAVPARCPECGSIDLRPVGQGTERLEHALATHFPDTPLVRIDRDTTRRKGSMEAMLETLREGAPALLIGTQMLAKGHHFPDVTLVAIVNADQGLFSLDFRAGERLAQQVVQVAGRAGRAERPGEVMIQSHQPEHPLLQRLVREGYRAYAEAALAERRDGAMPPFGFLALLRAEAVDAAAPTQFLREARDAAQAAGDGGVFLLGPVPAPMPRRAGRFRAQLLIQAEERQALHRQLDAWLELWEGLKSGRKVRWSLDVDPQDLY